jgi:enoyl-CoA hydratase
MMEYKNIILTIHDHLAVVTINRPDKLNALDEETKAELEEVFISFTENSDVGAVIVTGAGGKAFVAGTDIDELKSLDTESAKEYARRGQELFSLIENLGKPVIAAVNGYALGGGCELALACHIRVASENARFGQPEVNLGIMPGYGGTQRLPRLIGKGRATEMILTGTLIDAKEAWRIGLVNVVVSSADLMNASESIARSILAKGQVSIRNALNAINASDMTSMSNGLNIEAVLFGECFGTEDSKEGISAFQEKRKPAFKNK